MMVRNLVLGYAWSEPKMRAVGAVYAFLCGWFHGQVLGRLRQR